MTGASTLTTFTLRKTSILFIFTYFTCWYTQVVLVLILPIPTLPLCVLSGRSRPGRAPSPKRSGTGTGAGAVGARHASPRARQAPTAHSLGPQRHAHRLYFAGTTWRTPRTGKAYPFLWARAAAHAKRTGRRAGARSHTTRPLPSSSLRLYARVAAEADCFDRSPRCPVHTKEPTLHIQAPAHEIVRGVEHRPGHQNKVDFSGSAELQLCPLRASVSTRSLKL